MGLKKGLTIEIFIKSVHPFSIPRAGARDYPPIIPNPRDQPYRYRCQSLRKERSSIFLSKHTDRECSHFIPDEILEYLYLTFLDYNRADHPRSHRWSIVLSNPKSKEIILAFLRESLLSVCPTFKVQRFKARNFYIDAGSESIIDHSREIVIPGKVCCK
jgi:hypothetical protein